MTPDLPSWWTISNLDEVASPALLIYPNRIEENIRRMIAMAGGVARLRPHIKTHKLAEVVRMQMGQGINRYKAATIAEAEMAASSSSRCAPGLSTSRAERHASLGPGQRVPVDQIRGGGR